MARLLQPLRPLKLVPKGLWPLFFGCLLVHDLATRVTQAHRPVEQNLPQPHQQVLQISALGDPYFFASLGLIWLQYFDDQPGLTLSYQDLSYPTLVDWLSSFSELAPELQYPQFMASRLYANVNNPEKIRQILAFLHTTFLTDPERWRWLAEGAVIARHRLKDLPLALDYAKDLTDHSPPDAPYWVKDMQILLLEAMNEYDAALLLTGALLDSGTITDKHELNYLSEKLEELKTATENQPNGTSNLEPPIRKPKQP